MMSSPGSHDIGRTGSAVLFEHLIRRWCGSEQLVGRRWRSLRLVLVLLEEYLRNHNVPGAERLATGLLRFLRGHLLLWLVVMVTTTGVHGTRRRRNGVLQTGRDSRAWFGLPSVEKGTEGKGLPYGTVVSFFHFHLPLVAGFLLLR